VVQGFLLPRGDKFGKKYNTDSGVVTSSHEKGT